MANELRIADDLTLPIDAVTETFLIFGKRGSGKTTAASVLTEELLGAGLPVCVIDPMGAWWGLRSSADGQGPGLPVTILGGEHADLPLDSASGTAVAELVASERLPVVLDMFLMSKTQQRKFVTDFMERLFRRNREPLHLVIDEADRFASQGGERDPRLLGAYEDIVLRGRKPGIGSTSITLRPAQLHSAIRSQVEVLIAMRLLGKLDVAAIDEWIRLHASDEDAKELKDSLPSLPVGTAWVWSPGWLEVMRKIKVRPRRTFDSSATPKVGEQAITPRRFAPVNPADLERMAALLQREDKPVKGAAPSVDTSGLRKEISTLRAQLAEAGRHEPERVEVPVIAPGEIAALEQVVAALRDVAGSVELALGRATAPARVQPTAPKPALRPPAAPRPAAEAATPSGDTALSKAQRAILTVLAQFPEGRTKRQLGMLTGYSSKGGGFNNALSSLRTAGFIGRGEPVAATTEGIAALGDDWEPLPEGPALAAHWHAQLSKAESLVLGALLDAWPGSLTKAEVAERTGYAADGGGFNNALSRLRTLQLIDGRGELRADETLAAQAAEVRGPGA
jgi:DNA polymerase III delta prime subunit